MFNPDPGFTGTCATLAPMKGLLRRSKVEGILYIVCMCLVHRLWKTGQTAAPEINNDDCLDLDVELNVCRLVL